MGASDYEHRTPSDGVADGGPDAEPAGGSGQPIGRRGLLRAGAGLAGAAAFGGLGGVGTARAEPDYGGWFDDVDNYDGTVDRRGEDAVEVVVGAEGNGGTFAFEPAAVRIDPGTEVTFAWTSNTHNVLLESQPDGAAWTGHEPIEDDGFSFSQTFETEGIYLYYCQPHRGVGMKGAIVVGDVGAEDDGDDEDGPVELGEPDYGGWFDDVGNYESTVDSRGQDRATVTVGAEGNGGTFAFEPAAIRVDPGTEVTFDWVSDTHNVVVESQPEGADWAGHEPIEDTGFSFSHSFETEGIYTYFCQPHRGVGMKGAVVVGDIGPRIGGDDGPAAPAGPTITIPTTLAHTLVGGAALLAIAATVKTLREPFPEATPRRVAPATAEAPDEPYWERLGEDPATEPARSIDHETFDPVGTATLIVVYFLILVVMWVFMYFVEFLGGGPTVIG